MTVIATSRNLSMDTAGLIGRASGAGKSAILDAAAVRAFSNTLSSAEVASAISAAVSGIDLSGYLPLSGGTLSGNLGVSNIVGPGGSTSLVLNNAGTGGTFLQDNGGNRAWIGGSGVGIYTACYPINSNLYDLGLTTRFWRKLFVGSVVPLSADLIIRDGTTAQAVRIDKTYTSDTNCEFLRVGWTGSNFDITSEVGSAGGSNQPVRIGRKNAAGTFAGVSITTTGRLTWSAGVGFIDPDCPFELRSTRITDSGGNVRLETTGGLFLGTSRLVTWSSSANSFGAAAVGLSGLSTGVLEINNGTAGTYRDLICRDATLVPSASRTLGTNGQFAIEMTSNTAGNLVYRGSDGTTRRFAFTVS